MEYINGNQTFIYYGWGEINDSYSYSLLLPIQGEPYLHVEGVTLSIPVLRLYVLYYTSVFSWGISLQKKNGENTWKSRLYIFKCSVFDCWFFQLIQCKYKTTLLLIFWPTCTRVYKLLVTVQYLRSSCRKSQLYMKK